MRGERAKREGPRASSGGPRCQREPRKREGTREHIAKNVEYISNQEPGKGIKAPGLERCRGDLRQATGAE